MRNYLFLKWKHHIDWSSPWFTIYFQDLVKTHLMFAVREEVEVLRGRIGELEKHVSWLAIKKQKAKIMNLRKEQISYRQDSYHSNINLSNSWFIPRKWVIYLYHLEVLFCPDAKIMWMDQEKIVLIKVLNRTQSLKSII